MATTELSRADVDARGDRSLERALAAARTAAEHRGRDITILDLRELTSEFDFFVLVTGSSRRQLHTIADEVNRVLQKQLHDRRLGTEGYVDSRWILQDYGDVVVHCFDDEARKYYALDQLWCTAKRVEFVPPVVEPARHAPWEE
ncbi:MAG: ribosome silencing factor [Planctomycetes bacterium]|nr:ribosome silencing factor [Planctomycetota bacterium]